jgi:glutathione S-transferase
MDWQLSALNPAMVPLFWNLIRTPPDKRDRDAVDRALEKSTAAWQMVENQLEQTRYMGGNEFSLGDIPVGVWAYRWFNLPIERREFARLNAWYRGLCERPAYREHIMIPLS